MIKSILGGLGVIGFAAYLSSSAGAFCPEKCSHGAKTAQLASAPAGEPAPAAATGEKKPDCHHESGAPAGANKECCKKKGAQTASAEGSAPCAHAAKSGGCGSKTTAPAASSVEAALASMPSMKYRVGESDMCCPNAAKAMAASGEKPQPIKYVVGQEVFDNEPAAKVKLVAALESHLQDLQSMQFAVNGECLRCPMSAKELAAKTQSKMNYRVAGFDFAEQEKAEKAVALATEAAQKVQMVCKVDGKQVECNSAPAAGSPEAAKVTIVVEDQEVNSMETAKMLALQAKIRRAVEAAATVQKA